MRAVSGSRARRSRSAAIDSETLAVIGNPSRARRTAGSTTVFHGRRPARRCASASPATEPGTPEASGPSVDEGRGRSAAGEEEVAPGGARGDLAEVDDEGASLRVARDPESAAADVARLGPGDGEGEGDRDRGVRGVASAAQDLDADFGGGRLLGRDASAGPERGLRQVGAGERGCRREGEQECREPPFHCAILPAR